MLSLMCLIPSMKTFFGTKILHLKFLHGQSVYIFGMSNYCSSLQGCVISVECVLYLF